MTDEKPYPDSYDEADKKHADWWAEEMQDVKAIRNTIQEQIARNGYVTIAGSYINVDTSGDHKLRFTVEVDGKALEDFKRKDGDSGE